MSRRTDPSKAEEGQASSEDFDLDEFLHGVRKEFDENGHKKKHLGVSWENLHVEVKYMHIYSYYNHFIDLA